MDPYGRFKVFTRIMLFKSNDRLIQREIIKRGFTDGKVIYVYSYIITVCSSKNF